MEAAISAKSIGRHTIYVPQAGDARRDYGGTTVALEGTMLYWLKRAATELRLEAGRRHVHVAASIDVDQSTVYRFEAEEDAWPREPDMMVAAYADDLDVSPLAIWQRALEMWKASGEIAHVTDLKQYRQQQAASRSAAASAKARRASRRRQPQSGEEPGATGSPSR